MTEINKALTSVLNLYEQSDARPIADVLPLFFMLDGKPYSLRWSHFMFEPMFRLKNPPRKILYRCSRQIGKSVSLAASQILLAAAIPNRNLLTVTPFFEQVRKFSNNYVKPFIKTSPLKSMFAEGGNTDAVLQRSLSNGSNLFYSYSNGDPNRTRGVPVTLGLNLDEIQDLDMADLPVIEASMSASPYKLWRGTGTAKTFDNTIHQLWEDSSQAVWHIPCAACGRENKCAVDGELIQIIADDTIRCAFCKATIDSRAGYWVHSVPERQRIFAGYHIPQVILPMHYESPQAWAVLKEFQRDKPKYSFYNEILGESFDTGSKILTLDELRRACTIEERKPDEFDPSQYLMVTVGVDWGGRGKEKDTDSDEFISNTALAVAGLLPDGSIEIPFIWKVPYEMNHAEETRVVAQTAMMVQASWLAMDYGGQGNVLEEMVKAHGWPRERICPFTYMTMPPSRPIVHYKPPKAFGVRSSYILDKPRSILLNCELIKRQRIVFPKNNGYFENHLKDFMNIYLESKDDPRGPARRLVKRMARRTDDVVHAVNFACIAMFHSTGQWPKIAEAFVDTSAVTLDDDDPSL